MFDTRLIEGNNQKEMGWDWVWTSLCMYKLPQEEEGGGGGCLSFCMTVNSLAFKFLKNV